MKVKMVVKGWPGNVEFYLYEEKGTYDRYANSKGIQISVAEPVTLVFHRHDNDLGKAEPPTFVLPYKDAVEFCSSLAEVARESGIDTLLYERGLEKAEGEKIQILKKGEEIQILKNETEMARQKFQTAFYRMMADSMLKSG